jgi:hypothetical protein
LTRRQQSPNHPEKRKEDANNEHHPMPLADRDDAEGQEQDEVQESETYKTDGEVSE